MSELPVVDPQAIENLRALNPGDHDEFLREIVTIYLEDTPQRIAELDQSLTVADGPTFTRAAHSIKGSSANLGASIVRATAEKLEHQSKQGLTGVEPLLSQLKAEFEQARAELSKFLAAR